MGPEIILWTFWVIALAGCVALTIAAYRRRKHHGGDVPEDPSYFNSRGGRAEGSSTRRAE
jgi:hypothetical protein